MVHNWYIFRVDDEKFDKVSAKLSFSTKIATQSRKSHKTSNFYLL